MTLPIPEKTNLLNLDQQGLKEIFASLGEKPFRATQIMQWVYQAGVDDFEQMTNLGKALRERLEGRGTETPEDLERRLQKAADECREQERYDHVVVNQDLDLAVAQVRRIAGLDPRS